MRIGVVVDSACDLPKAFIDEHKIGILPITIRIGDRMFSDTRDPEATLEFYRKHMGDASRDAETAPYTVEQIRDVFLSGLVLEYDFVFCLTLMTSRSPIFENATKASFSILNDYKPIRAKAGVTGPFALRVIDTQNLFAGQGITAVEAVRMAQAGASPIKIRERLEYLAQNTYGYMLPNNLYHLRARAQKKGDKSVGWLQYALGSALDIKPLVRGYRGETGPVAKLRHFDEGAEKSFNYIAARVRKGLLTPTVCISYGGEVEALAKLPGYEALLKTCENAGVEVYVSNMSITGVVNVGEGALAFAFAAEPHETDV